MSRVLRKTILVYLSKSITIADIFPYWETDLLCIFNIVKDIIYDLIRGMSKMMMQSLKVKKSCYKTYRIENIMLENVSSYNLEVTSKVESS